MQVRSEADLVRLLYDQWVALRHAGGFKDVLPGCSTLSWGHPDGMPRGYVTLDYSLHQKVHLPGAWGEERDSMADLVEIYWSVRTLGGVQDMNWAPSLNAHVIDLENRPLEIADVERIYRYVIALRGALALGGIVDLRSRGREIGLHVRGLLLGAQLPEPVAAIGALAEYSDVPISVARFEISAGDGVRIHTSGRENDFFEVGVYHRDALSAAGASLIGQHALMRTAGIWALPDE